MTGKLFGTTGVRKVYGDEFDLQMALNLGKALGTYLKQGTILLARDARTTGLMIADAFAAGVMSTGVHVVRAGIIPTPTLALMTREYKYEAGVMVTASHNPPEYTGLKFWSSDSMGFDPKTEAELESIYESKKFKKAAWDALGTQRSIDTAVQDHIRALLESCDAELIRSKKFRVIVDPGNGTASVLTPYLMQELGCEVVSINAQLDGYFPGRKSEPEEESLGDLIRMIEETGADLGIAHDGDSDRGVFVTEQGEVIRGDRTIAVLAQVEMSTVKKPVLVTTVDSSMALDEVVEDAGGKTVRTPVGDIRVAMKIKEEKAVFGGEASGVFIFPDFHLAPDPFLAGCRLLEMMAREGKSFGELVDKVPRYPLKKTKIKCANSEKEAAMDRLQETLPKGFKDIREVIDVDGIGLVLKEGWVLVRPSGTEPVIRITCEGPTEDAVTRVLRETEEIVRKAVS
ncbi:phosphoglucosamine mutase [Candidatus Thorarchaeota archaeon]|nr:MAG: phosphoglucosamine mutase [Candidatus Thorarchaeota archaeon]